MTVVGTTPKAALVVALGCAACGAHGAPRPSPLAPSHAVAPRVAAFQPTMTEEPRREIVIERQRPRRDVRAGAGAVSDDVFLRALRAREPSLHRCFAAAVRRDPGLRAVKVPVHVRIGKGGRVEEARAGGGVVRLDACVVAVMRRMSFPPSGAPVDVEVPLFFRGS